MVLCAAAVAVPDADRLTRQTSLAEEIAWPEHRDYRFSARLLTVPDSLTAPDRMYITCRTRPLA